MFFSLSFLPRATFLYCISVVLVCPYSTVFILRCRDQNCAQYWRFEAHTADSFSKERQQLLAPQIHRNSGPEVVSICEPCCFPLWLWYWMGVTLGRWRMTVCAISFCFPLEKDRVNQDTELALIVTDTKKYWDTCRAEVECILTNHLKNLCQL